MVSVDVKHHVYLGPVVPNMSARHPRTLSHTSSGPRLYRSASALLSLQKGCGLWTLSCDFVPHNGPFSHKSSTAHAQWTGVRDLPDGGGNIKIVLIAAHLNAGVILVIGQCSDRYIISLFLYLHTLPLPVPNKPYGCVCILYIVSCHNNMYYVCET